MEIESLRLEFPKALNSPTNPEIETMKHHQTQRPREEKEGIRGKPLPGASLLLPSGTFTVIAWVQSEPNGLG